MPWLWFWLHHHGWVANEVVDQGFLNIFVAANCYMILWHRARISGIISLKVQAGWNVCGVNITEVFAFVLRYFMYFQSKCCHGFGCRRVVDFDYLQHYQLLQTFTMGSPGVNTKSCVAYLLGRIRMPYILLYYSLNHEQLL